MTDLISRLESAEAGSRELDAEIAALLGMPHGSREDVDIESRSIWYTEEIAGAYTQSLDAAIDLVERLLPEWEWALGMDWAVLKHGSIDLETIELDPQAIFGIPKRGKSTPALALCIALLSAIQTEEESL